MASVAFGSGDLNGSELNHVRHSFNIGMDVTRQCSEEIETDQRLHGKDDGQISTGNQYARRSWEKGQHVDMTNFAVPLMASKSNTSNCSILERGNFLDELVAENDYDFLLSSDWLNETAEQQPHYQTDNGMMHVTSMSSQDSSRFKVQGGFERMQSADVKINGDVYVTSQGVFSPNASPRSSMSMLSDIDEFLESAVANNYQEAQNYEIGLFSMQASEVEHSTSSTPKTDKSSIQNSRLNNNERCDELEDVSLQPMQTVDFNDKLAFMNSKIGLARPLLGPNGRVIFGTWSELNEDDLGKEITMNTTKHHIISTQIQSAWTTDAPGILKDGPGTDQVMDQEMHGKYAMHITGTRPVQGSIIDMQWLNPSKIAVACGSLVNVVDIGLSDYASYDIFSMNDVSFDYSHVMQLSSHSDMLREIAVGEGRCVASGGYDGKLIITDIEGSDANKTLVQFRTGGVIGSVKFHPTMSKVVSLTKDEGVAMLWDLRSGKTVAEYKSVQQNSYTHTWDGQHTLVMGFSKRSPQDQHLEFVDVRKPDRKKRKKRWQKRKKHKRGHFETTHKYGYADSNLDTVGDIIVAPGSQRGRRYICFGEPGFIVLDGKDAFNRQQLAPSCNYLCPDSDDTQTSGCILQDSNRQSILMTDSTGRASFFSLPGHLHRISL